MASEGSPSTRGSGARQAGAGSGGRIAAIVIAAAFLLLILAFMAMPFLKHDEARLNAVGPIAASAGQERGGVVFSGTASTWDVRGRVTVDARRHVRFAFDLISPTGEPAPANLIPALALDMPDHDVPALHPRVSREGPGRYAASAALPSDGRWRARVELPEIAAVLLFDVSE